MGLLIILNVRRDDSSKMISKVFRNILPANLKKATMKLFRKSFIKWED